LEKSGLKKRPLLFDHVILARWELGHCNARIEAFNENFQAANCRARGYRNDETFISIINLLAALMQNLLKST